MNLTRVIIAGLLALPACDAIEDAVLTHDLIDDDFASDGGAFFTGESGGYRAEVVDGKYRVTNIGSDVPVLETFGFFPRTAYNVVIEADIAAIAAPDSSVGLECVHTADGGSAGERYVFMVNMADGPLGDEASRFGLGFFDAADSPVEELVVQGGDSVGVGQRIGLHCDDRAITGLVNGDPVVQWLDPEYDSFEAAALVFAPWEANGEGDWAEFDEVTARVPEHGEGTVGVVVPDPTPAPDTPTTVEPLPTPESEDSAPAAVLDAAETGLLRDGGANDEHIDCINEQLAAEQVSFDYFTDDPPDYGPGFDAAFTSYAAVVADCLPPDVNQAILADAVPGDCFSETVANLGMKYSDFLRWLATPSSTDEFSELDAASEECG